MKKMLLVLLSCVMSVAAETHVWLGGTGAFSNATLWNGSVVPSIGDSIVISNGTVTVETTDVAFTGLVSIALGERGSLTCTGPLETAAAITFSQSNTITVVSGSLTVNGFASGTGFTKEGVGTLYFTGRTSTNTTWLPGLREMQLSGSFNLNTSNTGNRVSAGLDRANSIWPTNYTTTTYAYTGEIYLDGSTYSFVESVDDNILLQIGGATVLSNTLYTVASSNTLQLAAGWYPIDLRIGNNNGAGGSLNVFSTGGGIAWKKANLAWQVLRDFSGGSFLRSPGKQAIDLSEGILITTGTVTVCTDTATDTASTEAMNLLGNVTMNGGTLILSNTACRVFSLNGVSNALLRLDFAGMTLTNDIDCTYLGTSDGIGTWTKTGLGRLQWGTRSAYHYNHSATFVNNGTVAFGALITSVNEYNFGTFTINTPGKVETLINANTQFINLWGDGSITNTLNTGGPYQLRILTGPSDFSGQIDGNIRYYSCGAVTLSGTNSTFSGNFAIHSTSGPGITGVKKIGMNGQPSSIGKGGGVDIRELGGTFLYLGTGETTDKTFSLYPSANRAVINGGLYGGVTFNGTWSSSGGRLVRLALMGTNTAPCIFNNAYTEHSLYGTNYSTYIAKEGPGTWIFKHHTNRVNRGVVDVRQGTLQFESIAEAGIVCSLGRSDLLFADVITANTNGWGVPYAFSLGTPTTTGTLEYIGTNAASCSTRPLVLQGNGRLKSDTGSLMFASGIQSLTTGEKTLYLSGTATNALGSVSDGAGTVGITKEGSGTWILLNTNAFSGPLVIQSGNLVLNKHGYSYYRFTMTQRNYDVIGGDSNIELTELALYSANGIRHNLNLVKNGTNNITGLNPGEFCPMGSYPTYDNRTDINLFDNNINTQWTTGTGSFLPSTPMTLVMRLTNGAPAIAGFNLQYWAAMTNRYLSGWSLDGSRDGVSWVNLFTTNNYVPPAPAVVGSGKWWYSTGTTIPSTGFAISTGELTTQLKESTPISIATGASLTLLGGSEPIGVLNVDCDAGGGTINTLTLAATGEINLTGSAIHGRSFAIPLTIGALSNPNVLPNWTVTLNGQPAQGVGIRWNAETQSLWLYTLGTLILLN